MIPDSSELNKLRDHQFLFEDDKEETEMPETSKEAMRIAFDHTFKRGDK